MHACTKCAGCTKVIKPYHVRTHSHSSPGERRCVRMDFVGTHLTLEILSLKAAACWFPWWAAAAPHHLTRASLLSPITHHDIKISMQQLESSLTPHLERSSLCARVWRRIRECQSSAACAQECGQNWKDTWAQQLVRTRKKKKYN